MAFASSFSCSWFDGEKVDRFDGVLWAAIDGLYVFSRACWTAAGMIVFSFWRRLVLCASRRVRVVRSVACLRARSSLDVSDHAPGIILTYLEVRTACLSRVLTMLSDVSSWAMTLHTMPALKCVD